MRLLFFSSACQCWLSRLNIFLHVMTPNRPSSPIPSSSREDGSGIASPSAPTDSTSNANSIPLAETRGSIVWMPVGASAKNSRSPGCIIRKAPSSMGANANPLRSSTSTASRSLTTESVVPSGTINGILAAPKAGETWSSPSGH